jgi:hypothetical protein
LYLDRVLILLCVQPATAETVCVIAEEYKVGEGGLMVRVRIQATQEEAALIAKAARKTGDSANQFMSQVARKLSFSRRKAGTPRRRK